MYSCLQLNVNPLWKKRFLTRCYQGQVHFAFLTKGISHWKANWLPTTRGRPRSAYLLCHPCLSQMPSRCPEAPKHVMSTICQSSAAELWPVCGNFLSPVFCLGLVVSLALTIVGTPRCQLLSLCIACYPASRTLSTATQLKVFSVCSKYECLMRHCLPCNTSVSCVILFITAVSLRETLSLCQQCVAQTVLQGFCCTAVIRRAGNKETKIYAICVYLGNMNSLHFRFYFLSECIECDMDLIWLSLPGKSQTADEFFLRTSQKPTWVHCIIFHSVPIT